jgi:hypothetical protein
MPELPSLRDGRWIERKGFRPNPDRAGDDIKPYALYHVDWLLIDPQPFYPFPYRTRFQTIMYPDEGEGWYWGVELIPALRHNPRGISIVEWLDFEPATDARPFAWVTALAEHRLRLKHQGHPAHKPIKIGLNSGPGKLSQQKGAKADEKGNVIRIPPYFQPEWSGYILAATRGAIYDVSMQDPSSVISFNTDGIYTTRPLTVDRGEGLGQWETDQLDWFLTVQSGVYFFPDPDTASGVGQHYRGFDEGSITKERVLDALEAGQGVLECKLSRLVTLGQALHHKGDEQAFKRYHLSWRTAPRNLHLDLRTGKRHHLSVDDLERAAHELVPTRPKMRPERVISARSELAWEFESGILDQPDEEWDGTRLSAVLADFNR